MSDIGVWRGDAASLESTPGWIAQRSEEEKCGEFGPLRDEIRDSMNWSIGKRRFWLNSRIASFWLARSCERVETRR